MAEHFWEWVAIMWVGLATTCLAGLAGWPTVILLGLAGTTAAALGWLSFVRPRRVSVRIEAGQMVARNLWAKHSVPLGSVASVAVVDGRQVPVVLLEAAGQSFVIEALDPSASERWMPFLKATLKVGGGEESLVWRASGWRSLRESLADVFSQGWWRRQLRGYS